MYTLAQKWYIFNVKLSDVFWKNDLSETPSWQFYFTRKKQWFCTSVTSLTITGVLCYELQTVSFPQGLYATQKQLIKCSGRTEMGMIMRYRTYFLNFAIATEELIQGN